jgi:hypothetical protein
MKIRILTLLIAVIMILVCSFSSQAQSRSYTRGHVWTVSMIKTMPGMTDDYLTSLKSTIKAMDDAAVKQGLLISYKILLGQDANQSDWDVMILQEYADANAVNGNQDKWDAIQQSAVGDANALKQIMTTRTNMREIMGTKTMSEIAYK